MLGFPVPYTNELIYSTVARAGTHFGIESPKELLEEVFGNRKVIATLDLPCHLQKIAGLYPETLNLGVENLVNKHTLFPIYAPFVNEDRRLQCLNWMAGVSQGGGSFGAWRCCVKSSARPMPQVLSKMFGESTIWSWRIFLVSAVAGIRC